jgi:uncharacterized protein (DUF1499 family)
MSKIRLIRFLTLAVAVFALLLLLVSGPGAKQGWFDWRIGLYAFQAAAWFGLFAAAVALVLVLLMVHPRMRVRPWVPIAALCIGLAAAAPPLILRGQAKSVPPIHDITTDMQDPPPFVMLAAAREQGPNKAAYAGADIAQQQAKAYPDIKPVTLAMPPGDAVQKVIDTARSMGWEIASSDAPSGRVEATDTTGWFGFKDDIVVRVRPQAGGSRVDIRSASRVGRSDIGKNAARVRGFIAKLT